MKLLLTRLDAAEQAGVSESYIKKEIRDGHLPARKLGRLTRIHREEFEAWAKRQPRINVVNATGQDGAGTEQGQNQPIEKTVRVLP